jgi:hypothetical protein
MNTVGKILVILNFLFAIIVGALLVMNAAIGNQWKEAYLAQKNEFIILKGGRDTEGNTSRNIANDLQRKALENDAQRQKLYEEEKVRAAMEAGYKVQIANLNEQIDDKQKTNDVLTAAQKRYVEEINLLTKTIKDRESTIVKHEADNKVLQARALHAEAQGVTMASRNEYLLEEIRKITKDKALKDAGVNPGAIAVKSPNEPNPPPVNVSGKVQEVKDDLVVISLGTDHSVNKGNTLEIYRLQPEGKYLGMIRIVDANNHTSVGRLIPSGNANFRPALRVGDLVSSKITK